MSSKMKKFLFLIALVIVAALCVYLPKGHSATYAFDKIDNANFVQFKEMTRSELHSAVDQMLDDFIEDLTGWRSLWNTGKDFLGIGKNNKEQFIVETWSKNFNGPVSSIVDARVQMLISDLYAINAQCVNELRSTGIEVEGFDRAIKVALEKSIKHNVVEVSSGVVDRSVINQGIAVGAGIAAGLLVSKLLKSNFITAVVSLGVDAFVTLIVENRLQNDLKLKLKQDLIAGLDNALDDKDGLFPRLKESIDNFHIVRAKAWEQATNGANTI